MHELLAQAPRFELDVDEARQVLAQVVAVVDRCRDVARSPDVGLAESELDPFAPAFEHAELDEARTLLR